MRRLLALVALSMFVTTACTDQAPTPTDPGSMGPTAALTVPGCPTPTAIRQQITALFPLGQGLILAQATFDVIVLKVALGKTVDAQKLAAVLIQFTNSQFKAGKLRPTATAAKVAALNAALSCFVGLTPPGAADVSVGVVDPNQTGPTTVVTPTMQAGIQVQPSDVSEPTVVTVYSTTDTLLTDLAKFGPNYHFSSSAAGFNNPVLVGLCPEAPSDVLPKLWVAHNVPEPSPTGIQILPRASTSPLGLVCTPVVFSLRNGARSFAMRGLERLTEWLAPAPLSAATVGTGGVGGTTRNLSTFGAVLPAIPYGGTKYKYLLLGTEFPDTTGYTGTSYSDTGWPLGDAAFGAGSGCPLDPKVHTNWPVAPITSSSSEPSQTSDLLVRKIFDVPMEWTGTVTISVAIDNDVQVFINGHDITASAGTGTMVGGFQIHEGCATEGSFVFTASNDQLLIGQKNQIAVHARDRGSVSYFDLKVDLPPVVIP
jgi:hypothetical protein